MVFSETSFKYVYQHRITLCDKSKASSAFSRNNHKPALNCHWTWSNMTTLETVNIIREL